MPLFGGESSILPLGTSERLGGEEKKLGKRSKVYLRYVGKGRLAEGRVGASRVADADYLLRRHGCERKGPSRIRVEGEEPVAGIRKGWRNTFLSQQLYRDEGEEKLNRSLRRRTRAAPLQ